MLGGGVQPLDEAVVAWARGRASPWLDGLAIVGAVLGSGAATALALVVGSAVFWLTRHRLSLILLWVSLAGGRLLGAGLKALFDRPRPRPVAWDL